MSMIQDFRKRLREHYANNPDNQTTRNFSPKSDSYFVVMWNHPHVVNVDGAQHTVYPTYLLRDRNPSGVSDREFVSPACKAGDFGPLVESADCLKDNGWGDTSCIVLRGASVSGAAFIGDNTVMKDGASVGGFSYLRECELSGNARISDSYAESSQFGDSASVERSCVSSSRLEGNARVSESECSGSHLEWNAHMSQSQCSGCSLFDNSKCENSEMENTTLFGASEVRNHSKVVSNTKMYGSSVIDGSKVENSELRDVDVQNGSQIIKSQIAGGKFLNSYVYKTFLNATDGKVYNRQSVVVGEQSPKGMQTDVKAVESNGYDSRYEPLTFD